MKAIWSTIGAVVLATVLSPPSFAGVTVAGGELDPSVTTADVYISKPKAATPPAGAACQAAGKYAAYIESGHYDQVANLFADDAVVLDPRRQVMQGRDQIKKFYEGSIGSMKPEIIAVSFVGDKADCVVAFASRTDIGGAPRFKLTSLDHFTMGGHGKFARMVAFVRP